MGLHLICTHAGLSTAESGVKGLYGDCKSKGALAEMRVRFVNTSTEQLSLVPLQPGMRDAQGKA